MKHFLPLLLNICLFQQLTYSEEIPKLPDDGRRLQQAYLQAVEKAAKPIRDRYVLDLGRLVETYTRAGKLEEALALKTEIEMLDSKSDRAKARGLLGHWRSTIGGNSYSILADGTARLDNNQAKATWNIQNGDLVLHWSVGSTDTIPLSEAGNTVKGKSLNAEGTVTLPFTLTRLPK
jgi:hypothetical protein